VGVSSRAEVKTIIEGSADRENTEGNSEAEVRIIRTAVPRRRTLRREERERALKQKKIKRGTH
jgi:hypothetical protein